MRIRYEGPATLAGLLAGMLRNEGADVDYTPPVEKRSGGDVAQAVVMMFVGGVTYDVAKIAVAKFLSQFGGAARVDLDESEE